MPKREASESDEARKEKKKKKKKDGANGAHQLPESADLLRLMMVDVDRDRQRAQKMKSQAAHNRSWTAFVKQLNTLPNATAHSKLACVLKLLHQFSGVPITIEDTEDSLKLALFVRNALQAYHSNSHWSSGHEQAPKASHLKRATLMKQLQSLIHELRDTHSELEALR